MSRRKPTPAQQQVLDETYVAGGRAVFSWERGQMLNVVRRMYRLGLLTDYRTDHGMVRVSTRSEDV